MIIRKIKTGELYDTFYSDIHDEYWILDGDDCVRVLKPCEFRCLLYDREREYIVEKDD